MIKKKKEHRAEERFESMLCKKNVRSFQLAFPLEARLLYASQHSSSARRLESNFANFYLKQIRASNLNLCITQGSLGFSRELLSSLQRFNIRRILHALVRLSICFQAVFIQLPVTHFSSKLFSWECIERTNKIHFLCCATKFKAI